MSFERRKPRRVLALVRVSGNPQGRADESHEAQEFKISAYCRSQNYPKPAFTREIRTATRDTIDARPVLRSFIAQVREGDLVVVTKQERFARNTLVYLQLVKVIGERGALFFSIAEQFDPDTPQGRYAATIMAATAEHEGALIRERMVGTRKRMRDQGLWIEGLPPVGYQVVERRLVVVPEDAELVRLAAKRCIAGASINELVATLPLPTGPKRARKAWDKKAVASMLRSRVYLGEMLDSRGLWMGGRHEAILDPGTFALVAKALDGRRHKRGAGRGGAARTENWLLRRLATCAACGARMGAAYGACDNDYYACSKRCGAPYVRVDETDRAVSAATLDRLREIRAALASARDDSPRSPAPPNDRRARIQERRVRVLDMYESGRIDRSEFDKRLSRLEAEQAELDRADAEEARAARGADPSARIAVLRNVRKIERAWRNTSIGERRDTVRDLAERIDLRAGEPPRITWKSVERLATDV